MRKILGKSTFKEWSDKCKAKVQDNSMKIASFVSGFSVSILAMQLQSSAVEDTTISTGLSTWTSILSTVWTICVGNPLLASLSTSSLLFIGFALFKKARR